MNPMVSPFEADRGMLYRPRCAPTNRPTRYVPTIFPARQPLRATLEKPNVLNALFFTFEYCYKGALPSSPQRDYEDVHLFPRFPRLSPDRAAVARDAEI
jgi:hypothetical protein